MKADALLTPPITMKRPKRSDRASVMQGIDDIADLEHALDVRRGFFNDLLNADDWTFVVKGHAFLESACALMLAAALGQPRLRDIFAALEMSDARCGKIAFIKALRLFNERERRFVRTLSELRNQVVHNVGHAHFSLRDHLASAPSERRMNIVDALAIVKLRMTVGSKHFNSVEATLREPKLVAWHSLLHCTTRIYLETIAGENRRGEFDRLMARLLQKGPRKLTRMMATKLMNSALGIAPSSRRSPQR